MKTEQTQKTEKQAYTTPKLSTHGDVATLTQYVRPGGDGSHIIFTR